MHLNNYSWLPDDYEKLFKLNSLNFRTDEIIKNRDFVFSGCSYTFGDGLLNEGIWGNLISSSLNKESYNLAQVGSSVQRIVLNLFTYFRNFGNPKLVICLFPNLLRSCMVSDIDHMVDSRKNCLRDKKDATTVLYNIDSFNIDYVKISKQPHISEEIIPKEFLLFNSLQYIKMLEMYCQASNIKLLWGTWYLDDEIYISKSNVFNCFVNLENEKWHQNEEDNLISKYHKDGYEVYGHGSCLTSTQCHEEFRDIYGKNFDEPFDIDLKKNIAHYGVHRNIHIAESFLNKIDMKWFD
jgi:hypothetical protein